MPRKGSRKPKALLPIEGGPDSLYQHMRTYLAHMAEKHYSKETVSTWDRYLQQFLIWCDERAITTPKEIDLGLLERYRRHLYHHRKANGEPLAVSSQHIRLIPVRQWFKWMAKQGVIAFNPASELELPKRGQRLPKSILSAKEAEAVLAVPNPKTLMGLRDRAILETFYSTGMRRAELIHLKVSDIDFERGVVMIREGKGDKDRVVPIGKRAMAWIRAYLERSRPRLLRDWDGGILFLTKYGLPFSAVSMSRLTQGHIDQAGISKTGSCHLFRHTMATLMLENGADIRIIQAILGHADLSTTQVYTKVSIGHLKAIHASTHPGKMPCAGRELPEEG